MNVPDLLLLLTQIAVVFAVTQLCGWLLVRLRQLRVVGEITGGLLLGPLVFGGVFPATSVTLFPPSQLHGLEVLSNIGVVLFLFLIGSELDMQAVRRGRRVVAAITAGSVALPFAMGCALSLLLWKRFALPGASRLGFVLFCGIAMSITALPVLARMIEERRGTSRAVEGPIAAKVLLCAAANDLIAWILLAFTLAVVHESGGAATAKNLGLLALFLTGMFFVVRPLLSRRGPVWLWAAGGVVLAFASAHATELLGVHAFFGAFVAGLCMPRSTRILAMQEKLLRPIVFVSLPIFFALTGLRMQRETFLQDGLLWLAAVLICGVVGKIAGAALAAKASGTSWRDGIKIGVLMNTRGLVELIVLNIGYHEGILGPALFSIFVLMALMTTAMTAPLLDLRGSS